jgi:AcrR family transcriptional regulator
MGRDEKILQVAQRLFHERGFTAVGVDEIGEAAGITGPAIYRHFSGKDEILGTLFDQAVDELFARVAREFDDPVEELRFLARAHAEFVIAHEELASILIRDDRSLAGPYRRRHHRRERPYIDRWIGCLQRCFPERTREELTTATFAMLQVLNSVGNWPRSARRTENLAELIPDMVLGALSMLDGTGRSDVAERLRRPTAEDRADDTSDGSGAGSRVAKA